MNRRQRISGGKKMARSARHAAKKAAARPEKIARTKEHKFRNALRSSGEAYASELREYYFERDRFADGAG